MEPKYAIIRTANKEEIGALLLAGAVSCTDWSMLEAHGTIAPVSEAAVETFARPRDVPGVSSAAIAKSATAYANHRQAPNPPTDGTTRAGPRAVVAVRRETPARHQPSEKAAARRVQRSSLGGPISEAGA